MWKTSAAGGLRYTDVTPLKNTGQSNKVPGTFLAGTVAVVAGGLPLVTWPGLAAPFSTPKLLLLVGAVALLLPITAWRLARLRAGGGPPPATNARPVPFPLQALLVAWLAAFAWSALTAPTVSPEALALGVAGPLWCLLVAVNAVPFTLLAAAHVAGSTLAASLALAQAAGADPFVWLGWLPGIEGASTRMRVYGTLGNPNFVAALTAITLPLAASLAMAPAASRRMRAAAGLAVALLVMALACTGSRAGAIGLGCAGAVFGFFLGQPRGRWLTAGAVLAATIVVAISGGRELTETLGGRLYIWQTAWPHAWERPVSGTGPGTFELHYPGWETTRPGSRDRRFAGTQQFAHNDYLQALVERGIGGLVTTVMVLATPVFVWRHARRSTTDARTALAGAAGAVAACAGVAFLDFPLERPAETAALWMAVALAWQTTRPTLTTSPPGDRTP